MKLGPWQTLLMTVIFAVIVPLGAGPAIPYLGRAELLPSDYVGGHLVLFGGMFVATGSAAFGVTTLVRGLGGSKSLGLALGAVWALAMFIYYFVSIVLTACQWGCL